eukprot:11263422-Alexandrium_andersonii.AAC.1
MAVVAASVVALLRKWRRVLPYRCQRARNNRLRTRSRTHPHTQCSGNGSCDCSTTASATRAASGRKVAKMCSRTG